MFIRFMRDSRGTTAMEYGLIGSLVLVAATPMIRGYGESLKSNLYELIQAIGDVL